MYCPNCSSPLSTPKPPAACQNCGALFGADSKWSPTHEPVGKFDDRAASNVVSDSSIRPRGQKSSRSIVEFTFRWFIALILFFDAIIAVILLDGKTWIYDVGRASIVFLFFLLAGAVLSSRNIIALWFAAAVSVGVLLVVMLIVNAIVGAAFSR